MCLAVPGQLISVSGEGMARTGRVSFGGVSKEVSLALVPEAVEGDYVIVHVGAALSVVDEAEAEETFRYLQEMGELDSPPPSPSPFAEEGEAEEPA